MNWLVAIFLAVIVMTPGTDERLTVHLQDAAGEPVAGVRVTLFLYDLRGKTAYEVVIGSCTTDEQGSCDILIPSWAPRDASGMLRGVVQVGEYGRRSVLWPGGELRLPVNVDALHAGRESAPFDYERPMPGLVVRPGWQRHLALVLALVALVALVLWYWRQRS